VPGPAQPNPLPLSDASLWPPRLVSELSAWNEHVPFAGWIVEATQPRVFVELGTHIGVSYFAFCESVARLGLGTECFAVDTWHGDEHAGLYDESVYDSVREVNSRYYESFSRLLKSTFDEAVEEFDDSSIDLLHLDGLHTYEAVRHDFEMWLPKLSSSAVMLLHDTNERKQDFGVYQVMAELRDQYPTFEFMHGHGLGVVCIGEDVPEAIMALIGLEGPQATEIRNVYEALGRRLSAEVQQSVLSEAIADRDGKLGELSEAIVRRDGKIGELSEAIADRDGKLGELSEAIVRRDAELGVLSEAVADLRREVSSARKSFSRLKNRRTVRLALAVSRPLRPLFRFVRRIKNRQRHAGRPSPSKRAREIALPETPALPTTVRPLPPLGIRRSGDLIDRPPDPPVTIVVPIHNAFEDLERCLDALVRFTSEPARLILIDDGSTDERISELLERHTRFTNATVVRNDSNLGYTATINKGIEQSTGDVVLLNSDARVTPGWLDRLRLTARLNPSAGSITALSNNAGAFSAPAVGSNPVPLSLTEAEIGRLVAQGSERIYPSGPTGNGFCMYIRRACLDDIGLFDEVAFPRGYGEENDFGMRALRNGWGNIVDDTNYVFHTRSASFGQEKAGLMADGRSVVDERYPDYTALVSDFVNGEPLNAARGCVGGIFSAVDAGSLDVRPRVLFVLHESGGGTPATNRDLMAGLSDRFDAYVLTSNSRELFLSRMVDGEFVALDRWELEVPIYANSETRTDYRDIITAVLASFSIELVHIRHLISHTFDIPRVASRMGIPVIFSLHDYYMVCPTVHLIDDQGQFCGGTCTPGQGSCWLPTPWLQSLPHLKHEWVYEWRRRVELDVLPFVDAFVTTSRSVRELFCRTYPELKNRRFRVIEHGRDLDSADPPVASPPRADEPIRILLPGNLAQHKGIDLVKRIEGIDSANRIEFHILGSVESGYESVGVNHGPYDRESFIERARVIRPSFVGVLSTFAETYSHIVTEAWAAGIPVLGTDLGAVKERIETHGGGWIVDHRNPQRAYEQILEIASDPVRYEEGRSTATLRGVRTVSEMAADYSDLYAEVVQSRRAFRTEDASSSLGSRVLRVGAIVAGEPPRHPASVHIRLLLRLRHPAVASRVVATVVDLQRFLAGARQTFDLLVVQRTAIPPGSTDEFVDLCKRQGIPFVFEIDDNLWTLPPDSDEYEAYRPVLDGLEILARNAALVTVSTEPLQRHMAGLNDNIALVPNALDERLWLSGLTTASESRPWLAHGTQPVERGTVRILYHGTPTHRLDLEMFRGALDVFRVRSGLDVRFAVAGGQPVGEMDDDWFERIPIPPDARHYPDFVAWLRETAQYFDFGVAPLVDNEFSAAKSDLKYLEFAAIGLPAIYSDVPAYDSILDGETGLIACTREEWVECLTRLATDRNLRSAIRSNAYDDVVEHRLMGPNSVEYLGHLLHLDASDSLPMGV